MALLGKAALAMWWDIEPGVRADFEDWHSHEHFTERMGIPGFRRGSRWGQPDGAPGTFVLYELEAYEVLSSPAYLQRLNTPTPWSTRMMPHHRNMVRSQCRVLASRGGAVAGQALTVRLSPAPGRDAALQAAIAGQMEALVMRPGLVGLHLLQHQSPAIAPTTEQKIRGADTFADWVLLAFGYAQADLQALADTSFAEPALMEMGAAPGCVQGHYRLSYSATPGDVQ